MPTEPQNSVDSLVNSITSQSPQMGQGSDADSMADSIIHNDPEKYTGSFADHYFSSEPNGRILSAFGQGIAQGWGSSKVLSDFDDANYNKQHNAIIKTANEAYVRPIVAAGDLLNRVVQAGLSGIGGGVNQLGSELNTTARQQLDMAQSQKEKNPTLSAIETATAYGLGGTGEVLSEGIGHPVDPSDPNSGYQSFLPEPIGELSHIPKIYDARSKGIIGEGEAGYFNTKPVDPEVQAQRDDFAKHAGVEPTKPLPPVTDLRVLANEINPGVIDEFEQKLAYHDELAQRLEELSPSAGVMRTLGLDGTPTSIIPDTEELRQAKEAYIENYNRLKELEPQVQEAYSHAEDLIPAKKPGEEPTTATEKPVDDEGEAINTQAPAEETPATESSEGQLPPVPKDHARFFHGGSLPTEEGETRWASPNKEYAANYREGSPTFYTDVPKGHPDEVKARNWDEIDEKAETNAVGSYHSVELSPEMSKTLKPVPVAKVAEVSKVSKGDNLSVKGTGETYIRGLAQSIEDDAKASGLVDSLKDLPETRALVMREVWDKAADLAVNDSERALRIGTGLEEAPIGTTAFAVFKAVAKKALKEGDIDTIQKLASGLIPNLVGKAGQLLRSGVDDLADLNPALIIAKIQKSRANVIEKRLGGKKLDAEREKIGKEIQAHSSPISVSDLQSFIKSIECDY